LRRGNLANGNARPTAINPATFGLLQGLAASDPEWQPRLAAFKQRLQELG